MYARRYLLDIIHNFIDAIAPKDKTAPQEAMNHAFGILQTLLVIQKITAGACRALLLIK